MEGLLPVWKEVGMTSHDVVFKLRKILKTKKIGHSGTLDPDVDGVLPVAVGRATKVVEYMMDSEKIYRGEVTLGYATTTEDASGEIVEKKPVPLTLTEEDIDRILQTFQGDITQVPPMYSAVKVNGRRLYDYARAGETVDRPSRQVTIDSFTRTGPFTWDKEEETVRFPFRVICSKGTYVRTLAVDAGKLLGLPSHMSQLTREASSGFNETEALTLSQIEELAESGKIGERLHPLERALENFPMVELTDALYEKVKNGSLLEQEGYLVDDQEKVVFYYQKQAVAIYGSHPRKEGLIKPVKVLRNELKV